MFLAFDNEAAHELCIELDSWRSLLDSQLMLRREWEGRLRRDLEAEAIAASTSMEGVPVTVDEVRQILAGDVVANVPQADQKLVAGYREAMSFVLRRADDGHLQWHRELLVTLQDHVLARDYGGGAGRLRTRDPNVVNHKTGRVVFRPPPHGEVPGLVDELCAFLESADLHPALSAAWAHVAIAAVHPFADGNGRTARVAASLAMYRGGFRRPEFTSLEERWGRHLDEYYAAFECLGLEFDPTADVTPFILAHVKAQVQQVRALDLRRRTEQAIWVATSRLLQDAELPSRLSEALWDAFMQRPLTSTYYRSVADVSVATANNDLAAAVAHRLLVPHGRTRARTYTPGEQLYVRLGDLLGVDLASSAEHGRTVIVNELAARLARENLPVEADRDVDHFFKELNDISSADELLALDAAWIEAIHGRKLNRMSEARHRALRELGLRPARERGWSSVSRQLFEMAYRSLAPGRPWPGTVYQAAEHALLGLITQDLVTNDTYRTLTEPMASRFGWLGAPRSRHNRS